MTKKHFELLAKALADAYLQTDDDTYEHVHLFAHLVAIVGGVCEKSNPRFDYWRFHNRFYQLIGKD